MKRARTRDWKEIKGFFFFLQLVRMPGFKCPTYLRITMSMRRIIMAAAAMMMLLPLP